MIDYKLHIRIKLFVGDVPYESEQKIQKTGQPHNVRRDLCCYVVSGDFSGVFSCVSWKHARWKRPLCDGWAVRWADFRSPELSNNWGAYTDSILTPVYFNSIIESEKHQCRIFSIFIMCVFIYKNVSFLNGTTWTRCKNYIRVFGSIFYEKNGQIPMR